MTLEPAGLEHSSGRELVGRILEDASEGPLVRRLRGLSLSLQPDDDLLDLVGRSWPEQELDLRHDLSVAKVGVSVAQTEVGGRDPRGSVLIADIDPTTDLL